MKGFSNFLLAATLNLVCGCNLISDLFVVEPRGSGRAEEKTPRDSVGTERPVIPVFDTAVFLAAVRFPEHYDWRLDTACGNSDCEILLFYNGRIFQKFKAGRGTNVSSDPDFIHMVGNEIYTEYPGLTENIVSLNGNEIVRIPANERLKGILNMEGHFYTLTQDCLGTGIVLRKDGEELFHNGFGVLFGGLDDPSYPESGALYDDGDHYYFCYLEKGAHSTYHVVTDGEDRSISIPPNEVVLDMKVIQGEPEVATDAGFGYKWDYARLYTTGQGLLVAGQCAKDSEYAPVRSCVINATDGATDVLCSGETTIYCGDSASWGISHDQKGQISICSQNGWQDYLPDAYYFPSRRCAAPAGDELMIGLTPRDRSVPPKVMVGKEIYEPEGLGNGFIAGVSCKITQTN